MRILLAFTPFILVFCVHAYASDMALYAGQPNDGWYAKATMLSDVDKIIGGVRGLKEVKSFDDSALDDLQAWAEKNLTDGELDIIWLNGCTPSVLYPNPNVEPDGSIAEEWLDNGNMLINVADWFGYCTYETGARGVDNAAAGAENILDLPGIIRSANGTRITITDAGNEYLPSIGNSITTDRPVVGSAVREPWEVAEVFGGVEGGDMDPVVIYNTETDGYMAFINQGVLANSVDRARVTIEFINNWVAERIGFKAVEPASKIATFWGHVKRQ